MNLKWLFWTGLLAIVVFFGAIYFGIKYDWINSAKPDTSHAGANKKRLTSPYDVEPSNLIHSEVKSISKSPRKGMTPQLIDETDVVSENQTILGSVDLTIDEVVSECQSLSESIGIPEHKLELAVSECVDRNSRHLTAHERSVDRERAMLIREQCNVAITQKELLSNEEIKLLVDECVATMSTY